MKTRIIAFAAIIGILNIFCHNTMAQTQKVQAPFYFSLLGQVGIPQGQLKEYSNVRGGFSIEFGAPLKKISPFSAGLEISGIFSGSREDKFKGLEVETETTLVQLLPFLRWSPKKDLAVRPYIDFATGMGVAATTTTSTIVDEPTFLEQVLFNQESEVETTTHMSNSSTNLSLAIGTGVVIKNFLMVGVRYYHTNPTSYVDMNGVFVKDNSIQYDTKHIPLDMFVVTVGISNWGSH